MPLTTAELESTLWRAADILRGQIDSSDYKNYIFSMLFLKRLSDRFAEEVESAAAAGVSRAVAERDPDEHEFFVPPEARWDAIVRESMNLGEVVNRASARIEEENAPRLDGVLRNTNWNDETKLGSPVSRDGIINSLLKHFDALDDKIELNRRMGATLEAMARALFKSWFVDFEPVRAKAEGRPSGLPPALDALFPASFEASELGEIPSGWGVGTLGSLCEKPQYGYTQSAKTEPIGPKFLRITDINKRAWVEWESVPHCEISASDFTKYRLHDGDVLIARMADPGHGCMTEGQHDAVFASYLIRFRPLHPRFARFLQYWLRSDDYWELVSGRGAGTTRVSLNAKVLRDFPLLVPPGPLLEAFGNHVGGLRDRVVANADDSRTLTSQRDALLPRLVSGEVRVEWLR